MCPDDNDFSCIIVIAKIVDTAKTIKWAKVGIDQTKGENPEEIGSTVKWLDNVGPFEFDKVDYLQMIRSFKQQFA